MKPQVTLKLAKETEKGKKKMLRLNDEFGNELKKPLSAFILFCNYRRAGLHDEHPGKYKCN